MATGKSKQNERLNTSQVIDEIMRDSDFELSEFTKASLKIMQPVYVMYKMWWLNRQARMALAIRVH